MKSPEVLGVNNLQGVPPKGKSHQWELTNHPEIVHMCVVCGQQTKVIWRANGICFGYLDLFQDFKGAPKMTVERPDEKPVPTPAPKIKEKKPPKPKGLAALKRPMPEADQAPEALEPREEEKPALEAPNKSPKASKKEGKKKDDKVAKRPAGNRLQKGEETSDGK